LSLKTIIELVRNNAAASLRNFLAWLQRNKRKTCIFECYITTHLLAY
jgi:hypothetical protein